jgi:hypothetical protein
MHRGCSSKITSRARLHREWHIRNGGSLDGTLWDRTDKECGIWEVNHLKYMLLEVYYDANDTKLPL